mgnify:CR=1 FL=1
MVNKIEILLYHIILISEIKTVYQGSGTTKGVDADISDRITENNIEEVIAFAKQLSKKTLCIICHNGRTSTSK